MLVATCNVNGLRAAQRKGGPEWFAEANPDVLLIQEVRAPEELVADLIGPGYQIVQQASVLKGRAGVAIAVRDEYEIGRISIGLAAGLDPELGGTREGDAATSVLNPQEPPVDTGRWVEVDVPALHTTFVSTYLHSGVATKADKMEAKYSHLDRVTQRLAELQTNRAAKLPHVLVAGDFNIVHTPLDIKNWKPNHNKTAGVLDQEIAYLDKWFGVMGFSDVQRKLAGEVQGPYTWWSQRGKAFDNDAGWRIDYQMTTPELGELARTFRVDRAAGYDSRWSDHAPLLIDYDVN